MGFIQTQREKLLQHIRFNRISIKYNNSDPQMSDFISFGRHTCTLHCLHRERNTLSQSRLRHTVHSTHTRNGHVKEKEKSDRCRFFAFCILLLNAYNYFEYLLETYKAAHERKMMLLLFFQKLTMYTVCTTSRYMRWWFNRLFDDNAKNVYVPAWHSIEYLHSCYFCIFFIYCLFCFYTGRMGFNIWVKGGI